MHPDSIYVLNIENFLGFQKLKEDSEAVEIGGLDFFDGLSSYLQFHPTPLSGH